MLYALIIVVLVVLIAWLSASTFDHVRQRRAPRALKSHTRGFASVESLPTRPAPLLAGKSVEPVSRLEDIAGLMSSGDLILFSGRKPHSWLIRIATYSAYSHAGMIVRDDESLWIVDVCEGAGCKKRCLADEVKKWPGRWYWAALDHKHFRDFNRSKAAFAALSMVGGKYGYVGIFVQFCLYVPGLRELAFILSVDRWPYFRNQPPFCSQGVVVFAKAGGDDPGNGRPPQLMTPQDVAQSLLHSPHKIALLP